MAPIKAKISSHKTKGEERTAKDQSKTEVLLFSIYCHGEFKESCFFKASWRRQTSGPVVEAPGLWIQSWTLNCT